MIENASRATASASAPNGGQPAFESGKQGKRSEQPHYDTPGEKQNDPATTSTNGRPLKSYALEAFLSG